MADENASPSGRMACAMTPSSRARAGSERNSRARAVAGRGVGAPNRAMSRAPGQVHDRAEDVGSEVVEPPGRAGQQGAPHPAVAGVQPGRRLLDRAVQQRSRPLRQRVRAVDLGGGPAQAVLLEPVQGRGADGHGMEAGAVVDEQPQPHRVARRGATADLVGGLEDGDVDAVARQGQAGSEPVGPAADHDGCGHGATRSLSGSGPRWASPRGRRRSGLVQARRQDTVSGMGPLGSQGCSLTASRTSHDPRSMTPRAASMTWYCCVFLWMGWTRPRPR